MKKTVKMFLSLILIFSLCVPSFAEVLIQPMPETLKPSGITPIKAHPRLLLTADDIPDIKAAFDKEQNISAYNEYISKAFMETDGILPDSENYNYDEEIIGIIEAKAFYSLLNDNEEMAKDAITAITNYVSTLNYDEHTDLIYHVSSHVVFVAAEVYDWCYKYLTNNEKDTLIEAVQTKLLQVLNYGYPYENLHNATAFSNQTTFNMIIKDALGFSIAICDEYPDMFNYLSSVIIENFVDGRNYWYKSGKNPSGTSYGIVRHYSDMWLDIIFYKATGVKLLTDDVYKACYEYIYLFNPDTVHYRESDDNWYQTGGTNVSDYKDKTIYTDLILSSSHLKDGYLKAKALKMEEWIRKQTPTTDSPYLNVPWSYSHTQFTPVQYLILNNPDVEAKDISELPKSYYMGEPDGTLLARTGWDYGYQTDVATAFMKIGGQQLYNHNHFDYGTFQLHYKGNLMQDLGIYTYTTSPSYEAHNISTISHNGLLIYDPDEAVRFSTYNATYGNQNSGGQQVKYGVVGSGNLTKSLDDYDEKFFDRADVLYEYSDDKYSYLSGDITKAYSDKVEDVRRSMMFMPTGIKGAPAVFMVMDKITASEKRFKKSFLFQCLVEPIISGNAITLKRPLIRNSYYGSEITNQILAPAAFELKATGGPGKQWLVNGVNYLPEISSTNIDNNTRVDFGWGRIEISPKEENETDYFLNVMYMNDIGKFEGVQTAELIENDTFIGGKVLNQVSLFNKSNIAISGTADFTFEGDESLNIVITGIEEGIWNISKDGVVILENVIVTKEAGTINFKSEGGNFVLTQVSSSKEAVTKNPLFGGGEGRKENPYIISSAEQFYNIANEPDAFYILTEDIEIDNPDLLFEFSGSFDGNNHTITVDIEKNAQYIGLFTKLKRSSTVENLIIKGFVSGSSYVGALAGEATGRILNVKNYASVYAQRSYAGGIAGSYNSSYDRIKNCTNYGPVYAEVSYAGGICGISSAVVIYCGNYGEITAITSNAGGISGNSKCYIHKSFNAGLVTAGANAGGIVGLISASSISNSECINCFNIGDVYAKEAAGGIAGCDSGAGSSFNSVIKSCYNAGGVYINGMSADADYAILGGCTSTKETSIDYCYYLNNNLIKGREGTIPLTEAQLKSAKAYEGFDFENNWSIDSGEFNSPQIRYNEYQLFSGSYKNPVEITNEEQLNSIALNPNLNYILKNNISLESIASIDNFGGRLNGNGYEINIKNGIGAFFNKTAHTAVIENLTISGSVNIATSKNGVFTGINYGRIINCKNNAEVNVENGKTHVGAFAGHNAGEILSCVNYAPLNFYGHYSGGIAGYSTKKIYDCGNYGIITQKTGKTDTGGIVGQHQSSIPIEKCFNFKSVTGGVLTGGIVGNLNAAVHINNCFNNGEIKADAAGVAAGIAASVKNTASFAFCYNSGVIKIGEKNVSAEAAIYNTFPESSIPVIENCYYLASEGSGKEGTVSLSCEMLKKEESYANWDFVNIWTFDLSDSYEYPVLQSEYILPSAPVLYEPYNSDINVFSLNMLSNEKKFEILNKYVVMCFFKIHNGNTAYKLTDCGVVFSEIASAPEINGEDCSFISSYGSFDNVCGIILYGSKIKNAVYNVRPYAVYSKNGIPETIYGKTEKFNSILTLF